MAMGCNYQVYYPSKHTIGSSGNDIIADGPIVAWDCMLAGSWIMLPENMISIHVYCKQIGVEQSAYLRSLVNAFII